MPSKIEWTEETWNPIVGCTKVSAGCAHCYAERMANRLKAMGRPEYQDVVNGNGRWTGRVTLVPERLEQPLRWRKPRTVFVCSMSDLFHPKVPMYYHVNIWRAMADTPQHTYQILTKRPRAMRGRLEPLSQTFGVLPNVWLGVTAENQEAADERIPLLLQTPAAVRFVSAEPLLGPITLGGAVDYYHGNAYKPTLDWVIVGGESGPGARPMHPDWARSLMDQCQSAGVAFFFKQWGGPHKDRMLDGRTWDEMPEVSHATHQP